MPPWASKNDQKQPNAVFFAIFAKLLAERAKDPFWMGTKVAPIVMKLKANA